VVPNPHGVVSLRKLTRMKVVDAQSVHVFGFPRDMPSPQILSGPTMFGQFGAILSLRVIQGQGQASRAGSAMAPNSHPNNANSSQVLVRFADASSAILATAWCRVICGLGVQPGYNRYCVKFACGKRCHRAQCSKLHRWATVCAEQPRA